MSLQLIENQVLNFKNSLIDEPCVCKGKPFIRKVNKNDITEAEFISTVINSQPEFNSIGNWEKVIIGQALDPTAVFPYEYVSIDFDPLHPPLYFFEFGRDNPITGGLFAVNQNRFSIDDGVTWYNETTRPSLIFDSIGTGHYVCIVEDTIYGTVWSKVFDIA